jgi:hypothetical protein
MYKKYHKCELCKLVYTKDPDISYTQWNENRYCSNYCRLHDIKGKKNPNFGNHILSVTNRGTNNPNFKDGHTTYQHYCVDCGKKINRESVRCKSCFGKTRINKLSPAWRNGKTNNNKCIDCGVHISYSGVRCKSCAYKRDYRLGTRISRKGKENNRYGITPTPKFMRYKNILMRSSWEVAYAKYLDKLCVKWEYETKTFHLGETTYTPDFYLPKSKTYIEIKGYLSTESKKKINKFRKNFKNIKFFMYREADLRKMKVLK